MGKLFYRIRYALPFVKKLLVGEGALIIRQPVTRWDAQFRRGAWRRLFASPNTLYIAGWILRRAHEQGTEKPLRILDVGCGDGELAAALSEKRVEYWGTDISQEALAQAREKCPQGYFICAPMEKKPPVAGVFDVLVFNEVLYYAPPEQVLVSHLPLLKKGGAVVVSLYASWRAPFLWRRVHRILRCDERVRLCHNPRKHCWTVIMGDYGST